MEKPWEMALRWKKEEEEKQYIEIINKADLTAQELWLLTEKNFNEWRKKYDYPKLLKSFNEKLPSFLEWKTVYGISDEWIMDCSITEFMSPKKYAKKKPTKDKNKYLVEQTFDRNKKLVVAYVDMSLKDFDNNEHHEKFELVKKFVPYMDWCAAKNIKANIFNITQRQAPNHHLEKVWIDTGYELLKMGGIKAPVNGFGILLRGKHLEFVNLCGLEFEGDIYFGSEGNLSLSYCAADNLKCINLDMPLLRFEYCTIDNLRVENSTIQQWHFWECKTTGEIINSKLDSINMMGGQFTPFYKDTNISDIDATHKKHPHVNFSYTYSHLKKLYADQGDDAEASEYFIKEHELLREQSGGYHYVLKTISYFYWGYGKEPYRIILISMAVIFCCSLLYYFFQNLVTPSSSKTFLDSVYFSIVTFTTLGYGDLSPTGWLRMVAASEAFFGAFSIGFLVAGYSNAKY